MVTREREVEKYLVKRAESEGWMCLKFVPDQANGMPDRVIVLGEGAVKWVEVKTKGGELSDLQIYRHAQLKRAGHEVAVVWNKAQVDELVDALARDRS